MVCAQGVGNTVWQVGVGLLFLCSQVLLPLGVPPGQTCPSARRTMWTEPPDGWLVPLCDPVHQEILNLLGWGSRGSKKKVREEV